jgi:hypothetical protein
LTKESGGNVSHHSVVNATSLMLIDDDLIHCTENVGDMGNATSFCSAYRDRSDDILSARNSWICYDFKERRIVPTHYAIRWCHGVFHPVA